MLPLLWLAFTAPPITLDHVPAPILEPVVAQRLLAPPQCLAAACLHGEWQLSGLPEIPAGQRRLDAGDLPGTGSVLHIADRKRRDWMKPQGSNDRVGMQVGMNALSTDDASVAFSVDTAYRLQAYADDGTAGTGPVLRGQLEWRQALDDADTRTCISAERAMNRALHGSCHVPVAAYARLDGDTLSLAGLVGSAVDGRRVRAESQGHRDAADALGIHVAGLLLEQGARALIDAG